jgi:hypothetical protein
MNTTEQEQIRQANREACEEAARAWKDPQTGQREPDLEKAVRRMVCEYFDFPSRAGEDLYRVIADSEKVSDLASRIGMYNLDIYDEWIEAALLKALGEKNLLLVKRFEEEDSAIESVRELETAMEEEFLHGFEEECACTCPFVGLLQDYLQSTPLEKALINLIFRRLTNMQLPSLTPSWEYLQETKK